MKKIFPSSRFVLSSSLFLILFYFNALSQNYWERTSGPGTVVVYDFLFKDDFILIGTWIGGMYKSTDGGENWQHMENEFSYSSVYALKLLSNGNILAGTGSGIHISSDNGETWFHSALTDYLVSTITIDENGLIYIGSYYESDIYRSKDNGMSWNPLNSGISHIRSIVTKEPSTILVASGGIYRSSDKGLTWEQTLSPLKSIIDLALNQSGSISAISDYGSFYVSSDEGVTWDSVSSLNHSARSIYSSSNGDLYAGSYGVYRSINEGQTWNLLNGFQGSGLVQSIAEHENSFFAGTYFSGVFRSTDSGSNWFQSSNGLNHSIISLLEKDYVGKVYAVSLEAGLAVTSDIGENWEILGSMSGFHSFSASPNGSLFGSYGSVNMGVILRSTDSGHTWEAIYEDYEDTTVSQVNVNKDASVYAIMARKLFKSTNNGDSWFHIQVSTPDEYIQSVAFNNIGYIFIQSSSEYFRSSDNGATWEQLTSTPEGLVIFGITKTDDMYATASDSSYYSSSDYGNSWTYLSKGSGKPIRSFASNDIGYLFILEHFHNILRSTDNGISWQDINSGLDSTSINCLIITDDDYLLAGTSWGGVYRSVNKTTSVENSFTEIPNSFFLEQNYPNPFNPTTKIRYQVSAISHVSLKIYDVLGNEIAILVNEEKPAGFFEINFDAADLPSGIYFYQIRSGNFSETRKMILLK